MESSFWERLQRVMFEKKINQTELSDLVGIDNGTISRWKRRSTAPKNSSIKKISEKLGCSFDWLKTGEEESSEQQGQGSSKVIDNSVQSHIGFIGEREQQRFNQDMDGLFSIIKRWQSEENGQDSLTSMRFLQLFHERIPEFGEWLKKQKE